MLDLLVEMNLRFYVLCTIALLALGVPILLTLGVPFLADSNITATIHGATYAWDTLEPLNDTVININSNPPQSIVAKEGTYSFELGPGDYVITASYYQNNILIYSKEATLKIEGEGNYVFDLLLYPVSENQAVEATGDKANNINSVNPAGEARTGSFTVSYLGIALMLFLLLGGGYKLSRKHKETKKNRSHAGKFNTSGLLVKVLGKSTGSGVNSQFGNTGESVSVTEPVIEPLENSEIETAALRKLPLSTDLSEVLDVIRGRKGRITQKDLRNRLEYSEVKVSLLLSELEKRGLIKKFKNGRENIVVLINDEH
ncbi:MAG TPA: MarR family transcriptional regulator [Methanosarcina sp.]|nr:MarR family transcriptional regulator [Methanosarcina sp.]